jgi:ABC-2 type transport system permease protein
MFGLAAMSPVLFGFMSSMMQTLKDALPDDESYSQMIELYSSFSVSDMIMYNVEQLTGIGSIIILFLFKAAAGGEQKKRSVIIPRCAGLSAEKYIIPKCLIYPAFVFVVTVAAHFAGTGLSLMFFPGDVYWDLAWISALCTGMYLAFSTAMQLCIGLCTGRSNLAIIIVIVMHMAIPTVLGLFRVDRFNPFALSTLATNAATNSGESGNKLLSAAGSMSTSGDISSLNLIVSISTAVIISVILYFVTVFVIHTKEVHNEGDEPVL